MHERRLKSIVIGEIACQRCRPKMTESNSNSTTVYSKVRFIILCSYPGRNACLRFFQEIPEPSASADDFPGTSMFICDKCFAQCLGVTPDVIVDPISALSVAVLTTRLNEQLVDAPVLQISGERQRADVLDQVQFPGPVELDHRPERSRMSVEEVFGSSQAAAKLHGGHVVTEFKDAAVWFRRGRIDVRVPEQFNQPTQSGPRQPQQSSTEDLVPLAADVQHDRSSGTPPRRGRLRRGGRRTRLLRRLRQ